MRRIGVFLFAALASASSVALATTALSLALSDSARAQQASETSSGTSSETSAATSESDSDADSSDSSDSSSLSENFDLVEGIRVEGNERIETDTVRLYMRVEEGDPLSPQLINEAIKNLFATGLFADLQVSRDGNDLVVTVKENPIVNQIAFEGNEDIEDSSLRSELELRPRIVFTRARVQSDVERLTTVYRRAGLFAARIEPKIIRLPQNRVDLVFEIIEGPEATIERINFFGNSAFDDDSLRDVIATEESTWWRVLSNLDSYDPDRLEFDKELLRRHYLRNGYADFSVTSAIAELAPDGYSFYISFSVDEGEKYDFGEVSVDSGGADIDPERLEGLVEPSSGSTYDAGQIDRTVEQLTLEAGKAGFAFARVSPEIERNDDGTIDIVFRVDEGSRVYVERIEIVGNTRTRDEVIRRELRLVEGDAYNRILIDRSRRRITALDFFSQVEFEERPGSSPDKVVLVVKVEEKPTGSVNFAVGYSTSEQVLGNVAVTENNFLGKGQYVRLATSLSFKRQQLDFSFTEPYFMRRNLSFGVDAFAARTNQEAESSFKSRQYGGGLRLGFPLSEVSRTILNYNLSYRDITASSSSPKAVRDAKGGSLRSLAGLGYIYDTLDNPIDPSDGTRISLLGEFAGIGGDARFWRMEAKAHRFVPVGDAFKQALPMLESSRLMLRATGGHIAGWGGKEVLVLDRFFRGGETFRGFTRAGIGPREGGDSIGGTSYMIGTAELHFPLGLPEEFGIRGTAFSDMGTLFGVEPSDDDGTTLHSVKPKMRWSMGGGLLWNSPLGPLRFDFAEALFKHEKDDTELFRFSIGARF